MSATGWRRQQDESELRARDPAAYARMMETRRAANMAADQFNDDVNQARAGLAQPVRG